MIIKCIATLMFNLSAVCLAWLGYCWIYEGQGLHPLLAFPLSLLCAIIPYVVLLREAEERNVRITDLMEHIGKYDDEQLVEINNRIKGD